MTKQIQWSCIVTNNCMNEKHCAAKKVSIHISAPKLLWSLFICSASDFFVAQCLPARSKSLKMESNPCDTASCLDYKCCWGPGESRLGPEGTEEMEEQTSYLRPALVKQFTSCASLKPWGARWHNAVEASPSPPTFTFCQFWHFVYFIWVLFWMPLVRTSD